jgi:hypothetical protein
MPLRMSVDVLARLLRRHARLSRWKCTGDFAFALLLKDSGQFAKAFDDLKFPPKRKPVEFAMLLETAAFPCG